MEGRSRHHDDDYHNDHLLLVMMVVMTSMTVQFEGQNIHSRSQ
jgi:hypothetical protein